jgi:hypothetical protein
MAAEIKKEKEEKKANLFWDNFGSFFQPLNLIKF